MIFKNFLEDYGMIWVGNDNNSDNEKEEEHSEENETEEESLWNPGNFTRFNISFYFTRFQSSSLKY